MDKEKEKSINDAIELLQELVNKWQMSEDPYASIMEVDLEEGDIQIMETAVRLLKESRLRFPVEDIVFSKNDFEFENDDMSGESGYLWATGGLVNLLQFEDYLSENDNQEVQWEEARAYAENINFYPQYNNRTGEFGVLATYYLETEDGKEKCYDEELKLNKYETEYLKKEFCKEYHDKRYYEMLDEHKAEMDFDETERE